MNELYDKTIEVDGRTYRYDPDHDCFYRAPVALSAFDRYAWIVTIVILAAVSAYFEWYKL